MYAFVSNEYRTIVYTQRKLDFLCSIYSYPKFKKVENEYEAGKFFALTESLLTPVLISMGENQILDISL